MRKNSILVLTGFCIISSIYLHGQSTIWKFGSYGGLKFNADGTTSPHPGSASNSIMAATAMSDKDGNLMFYTDGANLWNRNNALVTAGLTGTGLTTCAPLIIPVPGQCNKYVVFSKNGSATDIGICLVTVTGTSPNYEVQVSTPESLGIESDQIGFADKLCATQDNNSISPGYWVAAHEIGGNHPDDGKTLYAFHMTQANMSSCTNSTDVVTALSNNVVTSTFTNTMQLLNPFVGQGQIKFSKDGTRLALVIASYGIIQIYSFNLATGIFYFVKSISISNINNPFCYGLEFSPDGNLLYTADQYNRNSTNELLRIMQIDYQSSTPTITTIGSGINNFGNSYSAFQIGPNNKIYISGFKDGNSTISVINNPNGVGNACQYSQNSVAISGTNKYMLPSSISGFTYPKLTVFPTSISNCSPQSTILTANGAQSYNWSPGSGTNNYFVVNPSATTTYTVNSILSNGCAASASIRVNIGSIATTPTIKALTYKLCPGTTSILLTIQEDNFYSGMSYQWQTIDCNNVPHDIPGATTNQYSVTSSNQYRLKIGCSGNFSYSNMIPIVQVTNCNFSSQVCSGQGGGSGGGIGERLNVSVEAEQTLMETLDLYPNPNNGVFNLSVTTGTSNESIISVINLWGKEVYKTGFSLTRGENKVQIDLTNYPKGIYLIRIQKGEKQLQMKMVYQ